MKVYLDNAATTAMDKQVIAAMFEVMDKHFGNPSSIHSYGREVRTLIENARKSIATLLHVSPAEIFFTSGATEANNTAISCSVRDLGVKHIITSPIEHHAVLNTAEELAKLGLAHLHLVRVNEQGVVDLNHLEALLQACSKANDGKTLVSLMHANNELGTLLPIEKVADLCMQEGALFHSDTVQTMAHYPIDLSRIPVHFVTCSAHKFHGPKGIGFLYIRAGVKIKPFVYGGAQERNMRGGTENVYGIVGIAKAFELANQDMEQEAAHISGLRSYMRERLIEQIPGVLFNGDSEHGLYTVLNVSFPPSPISEMLLFRLDIEGIACSGGSACSSGSDVGSHVLRAIGADPKRASVRFSFSKYNTKAEVDVCMEKLTEMFAVPAN